MHSDFIRSPGFLASKKTIEVKRLLLKCIQSATHDFVTAAQWYNTSRAEMARDVSKNIDAILSYIRAIRSIASKVAQHDVGDSSFIKTLLIDFEDIHETALSLENKLINSQASSMELVGHSLPTLLPDKGVKVYVSLYQADGQDFQQWLVQLASISQYIVARPIYQHEDHVCRVIRSKYSEESEAYIEVSVDPSNIVPTAEYHRKDRFGHNLLSLLPYAIIPENILAFVYRGRRYMYRNANLIPVG